MISSTMFHFQFFLCFVFPGTNWVGQIVTDLVITSAKKHKPHTLNEELLLAEFPYLEIGDTEKYKVSTEYFAKILKTVK